MSPKPAPTRVDGPGRGTPNVRPPGSCRRGRHPEGMDPPTPGVLYVSTSTVPRSCCGFTPESATTVHASVPSQQLFTPLYPTPLYPQGRLDASWQDWEPETPAEEQPAVSLYEEGAVELLAVPEGRTLMPRIITAEIPPGSRGGAAVDLGTVRLEARGDRRLTILNADGKPAETESVRVIHDGVLASPRHRPRTMSTTLCSCRSLLVTR